MTLKMWTIFADFKNGYFEEYLKLIKLTIEKDTLELEEKAKKMEASGAKPFTTEDGQYYDPFDEVSDHRWEIAEMAQLMYRTHIIGVFIFIESQINHVCKRVGEDKKEIFQYKDLKGNGVDRSIRYLKMISKEEFPADAILKKDFEIAKIVRNALVHREGDLEDIEKVKVDSYILSNPGLLSLKNNELIVGHDYAKYLINLSKKLCTELSKLEGSNPW